MMGVRPLEWLLRRVWCVNDGEPTGTAVGDTMPGTLVCCVSESILLSSCAFLLLRSTSSFKIRDSSSLSAGAAILMSCERQGGVTVV